MKLTNQSPKRFSRGDFFNEVFYYVMINIPLIANVIPMRVLYQQQKSISYPTFFTEIKNKRNVPKFRYIMCVNWNERYLKSCDWREKKKYDDIIIN